MIINLHMTNGYTTFQLASRNDLRALLGVELMEDKRPAEAFVRWNVDAPWVPVRLMFIRKASVAFVVSAEDEGAGLPALVIAEDRKQAWLEKQPEHEVVEQSEPVEVS